MFYDCAIHAGLRQKGIDVEDVAYGDREDDPDTLGEGPLAEVSNSNNINAFLQLALTFLFRFCVKTKMKSPSGFTISLS